MTTIDGRREDHIEVKFKDGICPRINTVITDDMIEEYKDPLVEKIRDLLFSNFNIPRCSKYDSFISAAEEIIDLVRKSND